MHYPIKPTIGVLALQGGYFEHLQMLKRDRRVNAVLVKTSKELEDIDALIIPGGESSVLNYLIQVGELLTPLKKFVQSGKCVWGTCAGLIVIADHIVDRGILTESCVGGLNVVVERNKFGSQLDSFSTHIKFNIFNEQQPNPPYECIFIRAPVVTEVKKGVEILATVEHESNIDYLVVGVKQNNIIGTSFHPELSHDIRWHRYFIELVLKNHNKN